MSSKKGFTLIELLIAISILAIVAAIGFVSYSQAQVIGRDSKRKQDLRSIQTGLELYKGQHASKVYPNTGCSAGSGCNSQAGGNWIAGTPAFDTSYLNKIPVDPINNSTFRYSYSSATGATYSLCANLENDSDPEAVSGNFCVTPP